VKISIKGRGISKGEGDTGEILENISSRLGVFIYTAFNDRGNKAISVHRTEYFSEAAAVTAASRMSHAR
jgi:hypothetical protein